MAIARLGLCSVMMAKSTSLTRSLALLGGVFNLLQSLAYLVAGGAALFIPLERIRGGTGEFASVYAESPAPFVILGLALVSLGLLGLTAVVPATAALLDEGFSGWVTVGKNIALLSLAVIVVYYTWFLSTIASFVAAYAAAPAELKGAVALNDPHAPANWVAWFIFGGMGLWVVIVGAIGWLGRSLPRAFAAACAIKTGGFWIALAGVVGSNIALAKVGMVVGVLIGGPLYHAWLGLILLRLAKGLS
jgi:hypothetical protein